MKFNRFLLLSGLLCFCSCDPDPDPTLTELLAAAPPAPFSLTAWEQAFFDAGGLPDSPAPEYLTAPDGLKLAFRDWVPTDWTGNGDMILLIPGSTSYPEHYAVLGQELSGLGLFTRIIDVRGMGLSVREGQDSYVNDFSPQTYSDDSLYYPGRIGDNLDENLSSGIFP